MKDVRHWNLGLPNWLTLIRLLLAVPISWAIISHRVFLAFGLFVVAAVTDFLDGRIARYTGRLHRYGAVFDLATDGTLFLAVILSLWGEGRLWEVWALGLILSGIIAIVAQVGFIRRERSPVIYGDRVGKLCGGATYLALALAILGKGTELVFPLAIPLIYLSVIRDWYKINHPSGSFAPVDRAQGVSAENDGLLWILAHWQVSPVGLVAWLVLAIALTDIALSLFYGTFWANGSIVSWTRDYRSLVIDFLVSPLVAFVWARTPSLTKNLLLSLSSVLPPGQKRRATAQIRTYQHILWRYVVPALLIFFELKWLVPAQWRTTRTEYFHDFHDFFAAKAILWVIVHYMIVMFFMNTTPAAFRVLKYIPKDGPLDIGHHDGVYGLSGVGSFVRDALGILFILGAMLVLVFYNEYAQSSILNTPYSLGLKFVALWPAPFLILYSVLLYRTHSLMAAFKKSLSCSTNQFSGSRAILLQAGLTPNVMRELSWAANTRRWIEELPVLPVPNTPLFLVYVLNAGVWSYLWRYGFKPLYRILSTGRY